ncbi:hypothetical protein [Kytococcus sedentarius]|uniref:kynureninase/PvdN C-terminal domain-containing protein n=1 Tax=Kytococcus sedentarius TaxID=1276 RepID=UPI0039C0E5AE
MLPPSSTGRAGPYAASLRGDGHPAAREVIAELWEQGVIPDFREPDGVRLGMSPASTSFAEVAEGLLLVDAELERAGRH